MDDESQRVWNSGWHSSLDGIYEAMAVVSEVKGGYTLHLDISYQGGEPRSESMGLIFPIPNLEQAKNMAALMLSRWMYDDMNEPE